MPHSDLPRLAILGAGPIGLEAAIRAATLKLPFTVYERGQMGEHVRRWGHVRLFSSFAMNSTPLGRARLREDHPAHSLPGESDILTGRDHLAAYLLPLSQSPLLREHIRTETTVVQIGRKGFLKEEALGDARRGQQPFLLLLRSDKREMIEEADVVLDCTGTYGQPRSLGDGGIPAIGETGARPHIAWGLEDVLGERRNVYADKTTLVVGAGYSAATTVCNLAKLAEKHPATWVIWLARGSGTQPIKRFVSDPLKERDQLAVRANMLATRGDGNVEFHAQTVVTAIECAGADKGFKVRALCAGKPRTWDVDRLIANVGYTPDNALYAELQVHEGCASLFSPPESGSLRNPEPNFFILGAKSYGRNSSFLLAEAYDQVREVFRLLIGNAELTSRFPGLRQSRKKLE
ncbi:MAG TPA: NAD(P)-binding domain-containing protein [Gemmataceae bacterium]|nr:NAD(P)-binding domain-containing protein [Gemmataceae bacterium]